VLVNGPYVIDPGGPKMTTFQMVDLPLPQQVGLVCEEILLYDRSM